MSSNRVAEEFDEISAVYDSTREPLETTTVDRMAETLQGWGVRRVLEVGVGTGRIAAPLTDRGLEVVGVDASRGMLGRARAKGLLRLVRGNAYRLPIRSATVDGTLFVHVLHLLDDPAGALTEGCRVARFGAVALVRPLAEEPTDEGPRLDPRKIVLDELEHQGVDVPPRARGGPRTAERQLLVDLPPDRLVTVQEGKVTERLDRDLALFERRASRWTLKVAPEKLARAVEVARVAIGDQTRSYRRVRALALWERPPAAPRSVPGH